MSGLDSAALDEWNASVGRSETRVEILEHESLRRYALAVGSDPVVERSMPPLGHWAFFLPQPEDGEIGEDGHPRRGGFLPAISLPRRMVAAAEVRCEAPLLLGREATMLSSVASVTHRKGRTGDLVFVDVDRTISQDGDVRIRERQTYVYRDMGSPLPMPIPLDGAIDGELLEPGTVNLFRFSAATFNSHRIHYDLPYAQEEEGYPALVVHGPFIAAKLAAFAGGEGELTRFSFRAQSPLFLGQPIRFQRGDGEVRAVRCDGATAMTAEVAYR